MPRATEPPLPPEPPPSGAARRAHSGRPRPTSADLRALGNVVIVLDEPQDVVNIAGVTRAMLNMGLSPLRLVRPMDFDPYRIQGIAHRSADLIAR